MTITRYQHPLAHPFAHALSRRAVGDFENQIEQLLGSAFGAFRGFDFGSFFPVDIYEDKDNAYVRAELPGVARSDINIEVVDGTLEISATRKDGAGDDIANVSLKRTVQIPENTQAGKISAACENGILTVTLPKSEQAKPRKFTVQVN